MKVVLGVLLIMAVLIPVCRRQSRHGSRQGGSWCELTSATTPSVVRAGSSTQARANSNISLADQFLTYVQK